MNVSIIIPCYNAADTLADALESLIAQTFTDWEAIVVDDGSRDETATLAEQFARRDNRIRAISQSHGGHGAARNTALEQARFDWLLFLDADDWILHTHLARMTSELVAHPEFDAVHCGWTQIRSDGKAGAAKFCPQSGDLFDLFARYCALAMNACVVRRALVESVGGFDPAMKTCGDWDMWQRVARFGARFGAVPQVLARHRMRSNSVSVNAMQLLRDGLTVITRGHSCDPRLVNAHLLHENDAPTEQLVRAKLYFATWAAALELARGGDPCVALDWIKEEKESTLDPDLVAGNIFQAALLPRCEIESAWVDLYPTWQSQIGLFLNALEQQVQVNDLARRTRVALERMIVHYATASRPFTIGATTATQIEITEPIFNLQTPMSTERLQCIVTLEDENIGTLELPVVDGRLDRSILANAIAADYAWKILERFFERSVYRKLRFESQENNVMILRGNVSLAKIAMYNKPVSIEELHRLVGWTIFLQEFWERRDWAVGRFYDSQTIERSRIKKRANEGWLEIEASADLAEVDVSGDQLNVLVTVGGSRLDLVNVPALKRKVFPNAIRAAITRESGSKLCVAAVRAGLLEKPLDDGGTLRERLADAWQTQHKKLDGE